VVHWELDQDQNHHPREINKMSIIVSYNNKIIKPAPSISINPEIYYANDNIIGYTYNVTLNGYANAIAATGIPSENSNLQYGPEYTVDHIKTITEIFNLNGKNLLVKDGDSTIFAASGASIKTIQFNQSDDKWINYSPFTIELEFNEVNLTGCSGNPNISCDTSIFHQLQNYNVVSDHLVDFKKFKIKAFNDQWTINIEDDIYNQSLGFYNNTFRVNYDISATGKQYYVNDKIVPAWQQARLFVQDKLYKQINNLIQGILPIEKDIISSCDATRNISILHKLSASGVLPRESGMFDSMDANTFETIKDCGTNPLYDVYNEKITCNTSESDGTFSIQYEALIKRYDKTKNPLSNAALHTFSKTDNEGNDGGGKTASLAIQGTITGLVRGGFIYYNVSDFILPQTGTLITSVSGLESKYSNAYSYYIDNVGDTSDLRDDIKNKLGINKAALFIDVPNATGEYPKPSNFSLDHNYHNGTITYNATYDRANTLSIDSGFNNISIVRNDPVDIIQEFVVPGRIGGPIIQNLGMKTSRTISISIEGASPSNRRCNIDDFCNSPFEIPMSNIDDLINLNNNNWIKTKEDYNHNMLDGSYSISLEYVSR